MLEAAFVLVGGFGEWRGDESCTFDVRLILSSKRRKVGKNNAANARHSDAELVAWAGLELYLKAAWHPE